MSTFWRTAWFGFTTSLLIVWTSVVLGSLKTLSPAFRGGNSAYDPRAMLKLLLYGYSYGIKSSRKLERAVHDNFSFVWLMGGLKPDHKTIAEFRRRNKRALSKVLKQCALVCMELDLIDGNVLFVDGTKLRANAGRGRTRDRGWYEKSVAELESRISRLLAECESVDESEREQGSLVRVKKDLAGAERRREAIAKALKALEERGLKKVNQTDPECAVMHSVQGSHASYNVQSVVDDKNGLIVHADAVNDSSDVNQFAAQISQAQEALGKKCDAACADAGYFDSAELAKIEAEGVAVIVPSQRQASEEKGREADRFGKKEFRYDQARDCYYCPEGRRLDYVGVDRNNGKIHYKIRKAKWCLNCRHYGVCTEAKDGRKIVRLPNEELKEKLEARYESAAGQEIYRRRKQRCEHPFGHLKRNLKADAFSLRGLEGARAEVSIWATCFDLARMITLVGVKGLIARLEGIEVAQQVMAA